MVANVRSASFRRHAPRALFALALALMVCSGALAEQAADKALEEQILKVIREHPKEIMEAVVGYQRAQAEQRMKSAESRLQEQVAALKAEELRGDCDCRDKWCAERLRPRPVSSITSAACSRCRSLARTLLISIDSWRRTSADNDASG